MLAKSMLLVASLLLVTGCKLELPNFGSGGISGPLTLETVTFERAGGPQCPDAVGTTPENIRCANVRLIYPKIVAAGTPAAVAAMNQYIQAQLLEYSDAEGKPPATPDELTSMFVADYNNVPEAAGLWEMVREVEVSFASEHLATLNIRESGYTGGAHPFSGQRYAVFDVNTGQQLTLKDLLVAGYEERLNLAGEQAFRRARGLGANDSLEEAGFWFASNAFKVNTNVGVSGDGLVFNFNPYEVAPYAMGPTAFTVGYAAINELIPDSSLLAALAR
ncbi:MAG: hypothetical protein BWK73_07495 [Thiothrix lacustris]|uniref:DUF3298 domain-containing protein n=1 Tax=Thiothrix lacustris TaxID=525917 RepID=A0A1Y1QVX9_9GAMM|nr:MAG: hypothetical protein BWK73_07495 [Thiothrix lacustris]